MPSPRRWRKTVFRLVARGARDRLLPHDQRVLAVVGVVAPANAPRLEAEALVEPDRSVVRDPDLQRVAAVGVVGGQLEQPLEQHRRDAAAPVLGRDGEDGRLCGYLVVSRYVDAWHVMNVAVAPEH